MSQRGKGDGPPPPMGFTDRGPCLQMALRKRSLFSSALSLSLSIAVGKEADSICCLPCLLDWGVENHSESQREKRTFLPRPSDQRKMLRNIFVLPNFSCLAQSVAQQFVLAYMNFYF